MDVAAWLQDLGLERYVPTFRDNEVDERVLPSLTAEDLKDLGVSLVGHRRLLLNAIAALRAPISPASIMTAARDASVPADAERRQLTVMFCDLVGSTALSSRLDPEDLREVISSYHRAVAVVVTGFDGFVAKYMGDGVLAYFGYPQAHEDDAERAVRTALALIEAVARLDVKSVPLHARVGIATGLVVVGDLIGEGSAQEQSVIGETPNVAARMQGLAEPDAVVIAVGTRRLLGDLFEYRDLGAVEVKGFSEPVPAWRVLRPGVVKSRFEALRGSTLSPLVGRDEEIDLLLRRWARAKAGNGQIVLVSGEAGLGKSRIAAALEERLQGESHLRLHYFCSPYHQDSALFPFIDQLSRASGFAHEDLPASRVEKLVAALARTEPPDEDVALLADLLSLPGSERYPLPDLGSQRKKDRTLEALIHQLEGLVRHQPVLVVFEDAHWIDPTSCELLDLAIERTRSLPVLLIVTFRPEFQPPWTGQPQVSMVTLNRLDRHDRATLVKHIAGGKALPDEVTAQIFERTDGVPLFVEEMTKSVLEGGLLREEADRYTLDGALPPFAVPMSLQDSLMARLDRLASVRHVAQTGAAIGREFSYELVHAVSRLPEEELQAGLARLVGAELVFQRGTPPAAVYAFKHALVQDAAHGSLLRSPRQQLHAQIAEALAAQSPELLDNQPEVFAQHYAEAGLVEKSVTYWGKAGRRSVARSAIAEAAAQFKKGLDQLKLLPDNPERKRRGLELYSSLGAVLYSVKGQGAPETGHAWARAQELWEKLDSPTEFLHLPFSQSFFHVVRGELDLAQRFDENLLRLSHQRNDSAGLVMGHHSTGRTLLYRGRFASSRSHQEEALTLLDGLPQRSFVGQAGFGLRVGILGFLGLALFCLGFPDQALARRSAAIAEAWRLAHPPSLAVTLALGGRLLLLVGDNEALAEQADQLVALSTEQGFPPFAAMGGIFRIWANAGESADPTEVITLLYRGSTALRATGAEHFLPHHTALLAKAYEIAGQLDEALTLLDDALRIAERTGERWLEAELYRHKGQLRLRQGCSEVAENLYRKALSIAEEQGAKLWELRAAATLARLYRDQGRQAEARDLLAPVYDWFTEGFDTPDLKEAKALRDQLA